MKKVLLILALLVLILFINTKSCFAFICRSNSLIIAITNITMITTQSNKVLKITTKKLPKIDLGSIYITELEAKGGNSPYSWKADKLPKFLKCDSTGVIYGKIPKKTKGHNLEIEIIIKDSSEIMQSAKKKFTLSIRQNNKTISVSKSLNKKTKNNKKENTIAIINGHKYSSEKLHQLEKKSGEILKALLNYNIKPRFISVPGTKKSPIKMTSKQLKNYIKNMLNIIEIFSDFESSNKKNIKQLKSRIKKHQEDSNELFLEFHVAELEYEKATLLKKLLPKNK